MKNLLFQKQWNWRTGGIALGAVFLVTVALVKPIGVSTQFVILDGIVWNVFSNDLIQEDDSESGYTSSNAYLSKSGGKYARNVANPLNYSLVFVLAMVLGGYMAKKMHPSEKPRVLIDSPPVWRERFGDSVYKRHLATFIGGALVLIGARLAGGCTSGHMMSGMMQTSVSGYLFSLGAFAAAVPTAIFLYRKGGLK